MLFLTFTFITLMVFSVVAFATRATPDQKAVGKRLALVSTLSTESGRGINEFDQLLKAAASEQFGWLEELMKRFSFTSRLQSLILQADSKITIGTLGAYSAGSAGGAALLAYMILRMWPLALLAGVLCGFVPVLLLKLRRSRRVNAFNKALPDAIDMMARSLRAGHSVVAAIGMIAENAVAPANFEFAEVFRKQNFGLPLKDALLQLQERVPSPDLRVVITGILVQKDTGGNLAEILDRTVHVIRERMRIQGEIRTHTAQGRMTGWILCALPIVMLLIINMINPGYSHVLFYDSFGRKILYTGVALLCIGGFIIRNIINGIEV